MECKLYRVIPYVVAENRNFSGVCLCLNGRVVWDEVIEDELETECEITENEDVITASVELETVPWYNYFETFELTRFQYYRIVQAVSESENANEWSLILEPLDVSESPTLFLE